MHALFDSCIPAEASSLELPPCIYPFSIKRNPVKQIGGGRRTLWVCSNIRSKKNNLYHLSDHNVIMDGASKYVNVFLHVPSIFFLQSVLVNSSENWPVLNSSAPLRLPYLS